MDRRCLTASLLPWTVLATAGLGCAPRPAHPATVVAASAPARPAGPVDAGSVGAIPILFRMSQRMPSSITCATLPVLPESRGWIDPDGGAAYEGPLMAGLAKDEIKRIIEQHVDAIRTCYEAVLVAEPYPHGRVMTRFSIDEFGQVRQSCLDSSTLNQPRVERCILDDILNWEFPKPRNGGWVIIQYPFVLEPAADDKAGSGAQRPPGATWATARG